MGNAFSKYVGNVSLKGRCGAWCEPAGARHLGMSTPGLDFLRQMSRHDMTFELVYFRQMLQRLSRHLRSGQGIARAGERR